VLTHHPEGKLLIKHENDNSIQLFFIYVQNNNPEANYEVSMSTQKETTVNLKTKYKIRQFI
jgi:uncharacterized protein YeaC (DUF1315 family)